MKKLAALAGILFLMISFQNCSKQGAGSNMDLPSGSQIADLQIPASQFPNMVLWDPAHQQYFDLDLKTGQMVTYEEYGNVRGDRYCLSSSDMQEVNSILAGSNVCVPSVNYNDVKDRICTTLYTYPYASLSDSQQEYRLGEMTSGCDQPVDLCGDRASMLQNFVKAVLSNLASKACN